MLPNFNLYKIYLMKLSQIILLPINLWIGTYRLI